MFGKSHRHQLDNNRYVDISVYTKKWTTTVNMSLWEERNGRALACEEKTYFNFEKILPVPIVTKIATHLLNKQSQKVAGFDFIK